MSLFNIGDQVTSIRGTAKGQTGRVVALNLPVEGWTTVQFSGKTSRTLKNPNNLRLTYTEDMQVDIGL